MTSQQFAGHADPNSANAIGAALSWLQGTLLGSVATTVAIVAVASVGFLMLTGRIDFRRAAQVLLGCFILFGASSIAAGIQAAAAGMGGADSGAPPLPAEPYDGPSPPPAYPPAATNPYDPYAGTAVAPR